MAAFCLKVPGSQFHVLLKDVLMAEMIFICEKKSFPTLLPKTMNI